MHKQIYYLWLQIFVGSALILLVSSQTAPANGLQCQRITIPACQGLGYNMTAMPNLAGHTNQLEAELHINKLLPLLESNCSSRVRFLLCSSLFPLCTPDVPRPVSACKSLCETVHAECSLNADLMKLWPEFLNCAILPQPEKYKLCMQIPQEQQFKEQQLLNQPEKQQENVTLEQQQQVTLTDIKQQQQQPIQIAVTVQQQKPQQQHFYWPWMHHAWKLNKQLNSNPNSDNSVAKQEQQQQSHYLPLCPTNFTLSQLPTINIGHVCLPKCEKDGFYTTAQKKHAESLVLGLSAVCFVLTLFSLVTFWAEPLRFSYPERPVLYLCLCYNLLSVCYLERLVFHSSQPVFTAIETSSAAVSLEGLPCALTPPCLASYITTSYLNLAAASWWLIFSVCFYLSSHKKWSSEALEQRSGLFHVLAWVPALAPPITALLLERVQLHELTGMCAARGFTDLPAFILLVLGLYFTLRTSRSLNLLQQQLQPAFGQQRFGQIRKRFLIFSLVFFLPTLGSLCASGFDRFIDHVPVCSSGTSECMLMEDNKRTPWPELLRIFLQLAGGSLTGMWVWSRKTCETYRNKLLNPPSSTPSTCKSLAALPKKHIYESANTKWAAYTSNTPLYSGINFHNVPVIYNPQHQQSV